MVEFYFLTKLNVSEYIGNISNENFQNLNYFETFNRFQQVIICQKINKLKLKFKQKRKKIQKDA